MPSFAPLDLVWVLKIYAWRILDNKYLTPMCTVQKDQNNRMWVSISGSHSASFPKSSMTLIVAHSMLTWTHIFRRRVQHTISVSAKRLLTFKITAKVFPPREEIPPPPKVISETCQVNLTSHSRKKKKKKNCYLSCKRTLRQKWTLHNYHEENIHFLLPFSS